MTDKLDQLLNAAVEAEKAEALARFRRAPLSVPRTVVATTSGRSTLFRNFALGGAVAGALALGVILLTPPRNQNPKIEIATVQRALFAANAALPDTALRHLDRHSDMSWTVQRAILRAQQPEYPNRDLSSSVLTALRKAQESEGRSLSSEYASPAELDERLERLVSKGTVERALQVADKKAHPGGKLPHTR
jgi:hypothetical protein